MITVEAVTKRYGAFTAADQSTFTARPGRVTGFLGPNGAGQVHHAAGHRRPHSTPLTGTAQVLGRRFVDLPNPGLEVGVLLDASAQHAGRTGREVLTLASEDDGAVTRGPGCPDARPGRASPMRRPTAESATTPWGCASAWASHTRSSGTPKSPSSTNPPTVWTPAGIPLDARPAPRGHADRGGTAFLSSHLLHEIEVVADDLIVIGRGRIVAAGTKAELLAVAGWEIDPVPDLPTDLPKR